MRDDEYIDRLKMPKSAVEALAKAHKLIRKWDATHAAMHDSQKLDDLLDLQHRQRGMGGQRLPRPAGRTEPGPELHHACPPTR